MSFSSSQKKRFYQVYPQDSKTVVGRFHLVGSLVRQQSLFHSNAGEIVNVCETTEGRHAEEVFINDHAKIKTVTNLPPGEKATLSLTIKITHSPCSKCRTVLMNFFASLPRNKGSQYSLCIQFANLYHESKSSANTVIQQLAEWSQSFEEIGVRTTFKPFCVTKDPEFAHTSLGITHEKFNEREVKDNNVTLHVQQIEELLKTDDLSREFKKKLSLKPSGTKNDGGDGSPPDDSGPQGPSGFPGGRGGSSGGTKSGPKGPSGQAGTSSASMQQANELKMQGNAALKKGDVQTAVKFYTKAIQLDPNNHALYTNRSMALCRQAKYERALQDAETSIQLKADWTKGYYHKGTALRHLNRFSEAASAYERALKIEPKNQEIKSALSVVNEKLMAKRIASGLSKGTGVAAPTRTPTKAEIQNERTRAAMEELHSEKKVRTLLKTGNALDDVPPAVRKALANCTSNQDVSSTEKLPTGTYVIHREKVKFPGGVVRCLSLHTRLEFSHQTVTKSGRVTIITNYYRMIYEWK